MRTRMDLCMIIGGSLTFGLGGGPGSSLGVLPGLPWWASLQVDIGGPVSGALAARAEATSALSPEFEFIGPARPAPASVMNDVAAGPAAWSGLRCIPRIGTVAVIKITAQGPPTAAPSRVTIGKQCRRRRSQRQTHTPRSPAGSWRCPPCCPSARAWAL